MDKLGKIITDIIGPELAGSFKETERTMFRHCPKKKHLGKLEGGGGGRVWVVDSQIIS